MTAWLAGTAAMLALVGLAQTVFVWWLAARFRRAVSGPPQGPCPTVSILKPLYGDEPLLFEALCSLCAQDYPAGVQIVFGVGQAGDTAVPVVEAVRARFPDLDLTLVVDGTRHGSNPKVSNLINMYPAARHGILVIADSDVHARPDYLRRLVAGLAGPGIGLVTVLYTGLPAIQCVASALGAAQIGLGFLPSALLARALGRQDCLGATMCLRRETLTAIGGFAALKDHLADDNVLGQLVRARGLSVALAGTVVATTVPERTLSALWRHETRWARTIRTLEPAGFAATILQYPLFWCVLVLIASGGALWAWILGLAAWAIRAVAADGISRVLLELQAGLAFRPPVWLLPARDWLSAAEWAAGFCGRRVDWRGQALDADTPRIAVPGHTEGSKPR